ncbi:fimbrial protein [Lonsdalea quercina]|uniref:fimbrial protein n=1 Tax=Lonsdalea quercina TaxID=71657 RepID=UPI003976A5C4
MKILCAYLMFVSLLFSCVTSSVFARNTQSVVIGGTVHMNGILSEGGCAVATDSQNMHIKMGQYTTHAFDRTGALSTHSVPFTLRLTGCAPDIADRVGITFSGMAAPKAPDLFLVISADGSPVGVSGDNGFSGLGLMISDQEGHQVIPGKVPTTFYRVNDSDVALHYIARYQATSRDVYPGPLRSNVRFDISYP